MLAVEAADVESAPLATKPDRDRLFDVLRDVEIRGEQVRGAGRQDRERRVGAGERVDAALHGPVAAPGEEELGALVKCTLHLFRGVAALRYLDPERIVDSLAREFPPEFGQAAAEGLPGMGDDRDLRHFRPLVAARFAARLTRTSALRAAMPTSAPPAMSSGWCMPRYIREKATKTGTRSATAQTAIWADRFVRREVRRSASPQ